ncbi:MAG: hypothetical protein Q8R40_04315 [bacterium]|nr:hypothetical protein [bacterium]
MDNNSGRNSNFTFIIFLIFLIPTLILVRGIYDVHYKRIGIMPLIPVSKADIPGESEGDSEADCEAEAESDGDSDSCEG